MRANFRFPWRTPDWVEPDAEIAPAPALDQADHDLIVRYTMVAIATMMAVAALWAAKVIAMPIVSGCMLGVVLGPVIDRMVRWGVPQAAAATALTIAVLATFIAIAAALTAPIAIWADQLPSLVDALRLKLDGVLSSVRRLEGLMGALSPKPAGAVTVSDGSVVADVAASSTAVAGGLLLFFATLLAYLSTRRHLKAQALRLCLGRNARVSTGRFFEEIETRMAAYFAIVTLINVGVGLATWLIAWRSGLPLAGVWGVVAFVMNYVAFVGPIVVTALLFAAGLIDNPSPWLAAAPAAAYYAIHLIEGNIVTPMAVGHRLTISPFLVLVSFVFWLWLWGPVGAILSTPILIFMALAIETRAHYAAAVAEEDEASVQPAPGGPDRASVVGAGVEASEQLSVPRVLPA